MNPHDKLYRASNEPDPEELRAWDRVSAVIVIAILLALIIMPALK